jgi:hypothetical protein
MSKTALNGSQQVRSKAPPVPQQTEASLLWILAIAPETMKSTDEIISHIIAPLSAQARMWGAARFGFARGLDESNPQVQLYLVASADVVGHVWKFAHALAEECSPHVGTVQISQSQPIIIPPPRGEPVPAALEAMLARYGGVEGIHLMGEVAELGSELTIWAVNRFPTGSMRSALGALLLFDTCHSMMRGARSSVWADRRTVSWDFYWDHYLGGCVESVGLNVEQSRRKLTDRVSPQIAGAHRIMVALASEPSVESWRKRWVHGIDTYLYRADRARISRSAQQLAMTQSRQLLNRLGVTLWDEAALSLYARAWSKDLEETPAAKRAGRPARRP